MSPTFSKISKNLNQNEKHFYYIYITLSKALNRTLNDNSFSDITFSAFSGEGINKISTKAIGKSAESIKKFWCEKCYLENDPPNYDVWNLFGQLNNVINMQIDLNVNEIPEIKTNQSQLAILTIGSKQNVTVKTGAFKSLKNLKYIFFSDVNISKFESHSLNFGSNTTGNLNIFLMKVNLTGDGFSPETFDGVSKPIDIFISHSSNINYFPETTFKSVFNNNRSRISFGNDTDLSYVDCSDCRNYWLVKQGKEKQLINPFCKQDAKKPVKRTLFSEQIKLDLKLFCEK